MPLSLLKKIVVYRYAYTFLENDKTFNTWDIAPGYQNSPLLLYLQARIYRERGENEALITLLESRPKKNRYPFYYLDFMLGKAKLNRLDPDADAPFLTFLSKYKGQNYLKAAHRYLAWHYHLRGSAKQRDYHIEMTLTRGKKMNGADQQALIDVAKPFNIALLRAQLYFDGGYLRKAQKELTSGAESYKTDSQRIEFHYRMGRIYQHMEEYLQAISSYNNVFVYEESANTFEAANAALQMGVIYEKLEKNAEAKAAYQKAIGYSGFPFQDGIHQKAKAGLARVK
jgi:tetratricopeptide (TPR) repeat protein